MGKERLHQGEGGQCLQHHGGVQAVYDADSVGSRHLFKVHGRCPGGRPILNPIGQSVRGQPKVVTEKKTKAGTRSVKEFYKPVRVLQEDNFMLEVEKARDGSQTQTPAQGQENAYYAGGLDQGGGGRPGQGSVQRGGEAGELQS